MTEPDPFEGEVERLLRAVEAVAFVERVRTVGDARASAFKELWAAWAATRDALAARQRATRALERPDVQTDERPEG